MFSKTGLLAISLATAGAGTILCMVPSEVAGPGLTVANFHRSVARPSRRSSSDPACRFDAIIREVASRYGVEAALVKAVIRVESGFDPEAVSRRGARGLMQLMPAVARTHGVSDVHDPRENIRAGVRHLRALLDRFHNDRRLAVAAYNAGSRSVARFRGMPPYRETRRYVARVLRYQRQYGARESLIPASDAA